MTNPYQHQYAPQDHWTRRMDSRPQPVYDDEDRYIDLDGLDPDGDDGRYIDVSFDYDAYNRRCLQNNAPPDIYDDDDDEYYYDDDYEDNYDYGDGSICQNQLPDDYNPDDYDIVLPDIPGAYVVISPDNTFYQDLRRKINEQNRANNRPILIMVDDQPPDIGLSPPDDDDPPPLLIQILGPTAKPC